MTEPRKYEYNGMMLTQKEICIRTGISQSTMSNRLRSGMTAAEAVAQGINPGKITHRSTEAIKTGAFIESTKRGTDMQRVMEAFETDSTGQRRKRWKFLSENEIYKIKENCRKCEHASMTGTTVSGCSYYDNVGHCRRCDPRDCKSLGFFEKKKRGPKRHKLPGVFH